MEALFLVLIIGFFALLAVWYRTSETLRLLSARIESVEAALRASERRAKRAPQAPTPTPAPTTEPAPEPARPEPGDSPSPLPAPSPPQRNGNEKRPVRPEELEIDWERWIGLRGAAVVGGIALVLAGIFLVQVAIQRGWLGPAARDALAFTAGIACLGAHTAIRARGSNYNVLADSLGGAGTVLVYGACWAAYRLHGLVDLSIAFTAMTLTTGICFALSFHAHAPALAMFALVGGFATPLLLNVVDGASLPLFAYMVALDVAILQLAKKRDWEWAFPIAVIGSLVIGATWTYGLDESTSYGAVAAVFMALVALFAWIPRVEAPKSGNHLHVAVQFFAQTAALALVAGPGAANTSATDVWPLVAYLLVHLVTAGTITRRTGTGAHLNVASVFAVIALGWLTFDLRVALVGSPTSSSGARYLGDWMLATAVLAVLLARASGTLGAFRRDSSRMHLASFWFAILSLTLLNVLFEHPARVDPLPWAVSGTVAILFVTGVLGIRGAKRTTFAATLVGVTAGSTLWFSVGPTPVDTVDLESPLTWTGLALALTLGAVATFAEQRGRRWSPEFRMAALCVALPPAATCVISRTNLPALAVIAATLAVITPMIPWCYRRWSSANLAGLAYAALSSFAVADWLEESGRFASSTSLALDAVCLTIIVGALPYSLAAHSTARSDESDTFTRLASYLSVPTLVLALAGKDVFGDHAMRVGLSATAGWTTVLTLGATLLGGAALFAWRARRSPRIARVFVAFAGFLVAFCIAYLTASLWVLVALALGAGWVALTAVRNGRSAPVPDTVLVSGAAALALIYLTFWNGAFAVEPWFVPLGLSIDYALSGIGVTLAALAARRLPRNRPARAPLCTFSVAVLLTIAFAWLNAVAINAFTSTGVIELHLEHSQPRELALSLAWAAFAGTVLALGLWLRSAALRWVSLCLMIITVSKVFLYDLKNLEGLSRVASFFGLSIALLGVSLTYARILASDRDVTPDAGLNA